MGELHQSHEKLPVVGHSQLVLTFPIPFGLLPGANCQQVQGAVGLTWGTVPVKLRYFR